MEASPLTQDVRPDSFQPKIVKLYETILSEDEEPNELSEGFWRELYLLKPDAARLRRLLEDQGPDDLLQLQTRTQLLFLQSIEHINAGKAPSDENAIDTLTVFLGSVLTKRFSNPSSDVLVVLAGLDDADPALSRFAACLDTTIRNSRSMELRLKAVKLAISFTAGAYQTGLVSYFVHRELFLPLMKCISDCQHDNDIVEPFVLLGLLANYNKFEFENPYRSRLDVYINGTTIRKIVHGVGQICRSMRDKYVAVQDDIPETWNIGSTLSYVGLGALVGSRPTTPVPGAEEAKNLFSALPGPEAAILLATFEFANANKAFSSAMVTLTPDIRVESTPFSEYLSFMSYLFQHAHLSARASYYTYLTLFILQILIEDRDILKRICSDDSKTQVRLCRQRAPFLPLVKGERILATVILDIMVDGINHNLRRRLDVDYYILCIGILLRLVSHLSRSRTRLAYHWPELWRSLLAFIRFLATYAEDVRSLPRHSELINDITDLIAYAMSTGESFLPDPAAYDDLFYKLVETGDIVAKFKDAYNLGNGKATRASSVDTLLNVSKHYNAMLEGDDASRAKQQHLSPKVVTKVIKQGYETLSIQAKEDLDHWKEFREADHRVVLKRITRVAIEDAKALTEDP